MPAAASSPSVAELERRIEELGVENARLLAEQRETLEPAHLLHLGRVDAPSASMAASILVISSTIELLS